MAGKASTYWPNGKKPSIGSTVSGCDIGKKSRGIFTWSACPDCGLERWVSKRQVTKLCMRCAAIRRDLTGVRNPRWKGGVRQGDDGYRYISVPEDHPLIEMAGRVFVHGKYRYYIAEHRLVMAERLCRPLKPWELVHHKGTKYPSTDIRNKGDNRFENLERLAHKQEHLPSMNVERIVTNLQTRVTLLEAEVARLQSLLEGGQDSATRDSHLNLKHYNTLGNLLDRQVEGIVRTPSNRGESNGSALLPSWSSTASKIDGASVEQSTDKLTANSGKPKLGNEHGNPELSGGSNAP